MPEIMTVNDLLIGKTLYAQMLDDVSLKLPEEACGIVAGRAGRATKIIPVTNELHCQTRFRMDAKEQIRVFLEIEQQELELLAIYHSHPTGPAYPSATDRAEFAYPGVMTLIWIPGEEDWECRAYWIDGGEISEAVYLLDQTR